MSPPHPHRAESRSYPSAERDGGTGEREPPPRGQQLCPRPAPAPRGWGHTAVGERRQLSVPCPSCLCPVRALCVPSLCPVCALLVPSVPCPCPSVPCPCPIFALPDLPMPCPCPARPSCPRPLTYGAAKFRPRSQSGSCSCSSSCEKRQQRQIPPGEKDSAWPRPARHGPRRTAGEEKKKGIEGRGRTERKPRHSKPFFLHQDKIRTRSISSHLESGSTGGDPVELSLKASGGDRGDI